MPGIHTCLAILFIAALIILPYALFKNASNTKVKGEFLRDRRLAQEKVGQATTTLTNRDIRQLPTLAQKHLSASGSVGRPLVTSVNLYTEDAQFFQSRTKRPLNLNYSLLHFAPEPIRLVYLKTSVATIPYEGYDRITSDGFSLSGSMRKLMPAFNQPANMTAKNQLVAYLAQSFMLPQSLLAGHITLEQIDDSHVRGTISYKDTSASGIFAFGDEGLLNSFRSSDCTRFDFGNKAEQLDWSMYFEDYQISDGVLLPNSIRAVWHDLDGVDFSYFSAKNFKRSRSPVSGIQSKAFSKTHSKGDTKIFPWEPPSQR